MEFDMSILWTILIGFVAGVLAKLITPGKNEPQGFILTTILGIVGAFVATYLGQALGWYRADEGAGLIGATVGAVIVLLIWAAVAGRRRSLRRSSHRSTSRRAKQFPLRSPTAWQTPQSGFSQPGREG
jgi:uncharacterized membrane protein YeaQ/YmgE (transglycosylase-associated protein family)